MPNTQAEFPVTPLYNPQNKAMLLTTTITYGIFHTEYSNN